jgi:superfamily II DNA or RNA helicase
MISLLRTASADISSFLEASLPSLSPDWWVKHVLDRLNFQQQRIAREKNICKISEFDFAALLRILDQNWFDLSSKQVLPREARSWLKELQSVRNKWAHLGGQDLPYGEVYRDADTLGRFLEAIGASQETLDAVVAAKAEALLKMSENLTSNQVYAPSTAHISVDSRSQTSGQVAFSCFSSGDLVALKSDPSIILPIIEVIPGRGETRYRVFEGGQKRTYYESQIQAIVNDHEPIPVSADEIRARMTSWQVLSRSTNSLYSLRSGRVQFVPYQYRPVLKLIRADRPRILIADEVGVGKTIEAGLIIKELRARMDIQSVLVICPKALVAEKKWFTEMKRFDEHFVALDGSGLRHCLNETDLEGEWPETHSKAIIPFSLFDSELLVGTPAKRGKRKSKGISDLEPAPQFDLVIVDEAHHIRNSETFLHQGVRAFCDNAQAVVLLTATPVQLGSNDLFTLLNVLRPDLVIDQASFEQMAAPNGFINRSIHECRVAEPEWQVRAREALLGASNTEWGRLFLRESPRFQTVFDALNQGEIDDLARIVLIRDLEELYTFSPLINRTRRRDIGDFTTRKPETILVEFTQVQREIHDGLLNIIARVLGRLHGDQNVKFMMTTIRRQAASCLYGLAPLLSELLEGKIDQLEVMEASDGDSGPDSAFVDMIRSDVGNLLKLAGALDGHDPKIETFKRVLADKGSLERNKSLVFTTFRHTLAYLAKHAETVGLRIGVVHGGVADEERADLRHRFSLPKEAPDAIDVLLSSEVGCEGLDFQFCDMVVNYDLPWNPMRIEQRIGRIDRYGQASDTVAIMNFVTPGTVDGDIYERCLWRIGVFQHSVGGNEEILGEITREIHAIAESFTLDESAKAARLQQLSDNAIRRVREEEDLEAKQAELFGLEVPQASWRKDLEAADTFWLSPPAVEGMLRHYLAERLNSTNDHILGAGQIKTLRLSQEQRNSLLTDFGKRRPSETVEREWDKWLMGHVPTLTITFDQEAAVQDRKSAFLSVSHPLVRQAAKFFEREAPQYCVIRIDKADLPMGTYPFAVYRWSKHGVRDDELLVAVADDPQIEGAILSALPAATQATGKLPEQPVLDALDERHHTKWARAQAEHVEANRQMVEYRVQSLSVSHRARVRVIEDQIERATNDKIKVMRRGELARAQADFERHMADLEKAAEGGDIRANAVVFGSLEVREFAQ